MNGIEQLSDQVPLSGIHFLLIYHFKKNGFAIGDVDDLCRFIPDIAIFQGTNRNAFLLWQSLVKNEKNQNEGN